MQDRIVDGSNNTCDVFPYNEVRLDTKSLCASANVIPGVAVTLMQGTSAFPIPCAGDSTSFMIFMRVDSQTSIPY